MVGIVIVSHSKNLAESVVELTAMMAPGASIKAAGGLEDGSLGTSFERIRDAIEAVYCDDGVIVLMDMGSAVMTTEMVIEMLGRENVIMADCPLVEGAVTATLDAVLGMDLKAIKEDLAGVAFAKKW